MRVTKQDLNKIRDKINEFLRLQGKEERFDCQRNFQYINIVLYDEPNSNGCLLIKGGLTKREGLEVLNKIYHILTVDKASIFCYNLNC